MGKLRWSYSETKKHADNIRAMRDRRMRQAAREAGIDATMCGLMAHNAMCAWNAGTPWREVDYSKVRKVLWLERHLFDGYRILERYVDKRNREPGGCSWIMAEQGKFA